MTNKEFGTEGESTRRDIPYLSFSDGFQPEDSLDGDPPDIDEYSFPVEQVSDEDLDYTLPDVGLESLPRDNRPMRIDGFQPTNSLDGDPPDIYDY